MARDQAVDENGLELDQEGFAGPPAQQQARPAAVQGNGGNGAPSRRNGGNGNEGEEKDAKIAQLEARVKLLEANAGLEARRDQVALVGDVLDANQAQCEYIRSEVEQAFDDYGDNLIDAVADRVLQRQLEELGVEDENGAKTANGKPKTKREEPEELPVERVTKVSVPRLYQGETEPDVVAYIDADDGTEQTRKGRKRGGAYGFVVEQID